MHLCILRGDFFFSLKAVYFKICHILEKGKIIQISEIIFECYYTESNINFLKYKNQVNILQLVWSLKKYISANIPINILNSLHRSLYYNRIFQIGKRKILHPQILHSALKLELHFKNKEKN